MSDDDDFTPFLPHIPDGCMPVFGVLVFGYLDGDGQVCGGWHTVGEYATAEVVGHMEMAKHFVISASVKTEDED